MRKAGLKRPPWMAAMYTLVSKMSHLAVSIQRLDMTMPLHHKGPQGFHQGSLVGHQVQGPVDSFGLRFGSQDPLGPIQFGHVDAIVLALHLARHRRSSLRKSRTDS